MRTHLPTLALVAALALSGAAVAQVPSGGFGTDAKGNAPVKRTHTVNDGTARRGRNSFTERQARGHIERAGFTGVTGLTKGQDGVWRGQAMKNGASVEVGMDFKGNVTEGGAMSATPGRTPPAPDRMETRSETDAARGPAPMAAPAEASAATTTTTMGTKHAARSHHRRHHRHARALRRCAGAAARGAACSGVDRNRNGVSDKEDRGLRTGVPR